MSGIIIRDGNPISLEKITKCAQPLGMADKYYNPDYLRAEVNKRIAKLLKKAKRSPIFTLEELDTIFKQRDLPISGNEFVDQGEFHTHNMRYYMNEMINNKGEKAYLLMNTTGYASAY